MKPLRTIRVLIVDDNNIVQSTLKMVLERKQKFRIVAQASDGQQAIKLYQQHQPDIVLTDIIMDKLTGIEMCQQIIQIAPLARVILLSGLILQDSMISLALKAGISGYLLKDLSMKELEDYLIACYQGEKVFHPHIQKILENKFPAKN